MTLDRAELVCAGCSFHPYLNSYIQKAVDVFPMLYYGEVVILLFLIF